MIKFLIASYFATITLFNMPEGNTSAPFLSKQQSQKPLFSFGVVADVQYCDCDPAGSRFYRSSTRKLSEAVKTFKTDSVSFIINLGDIIDRDFSSYKPVMDIIESSGLKTYHLTGNHDYAVGPGLKKNLPVSGSSETGYYSFNIKNFRLIVLNGNEQSTYSSDNKAETKQAEDRLTEMKARGDINAVEWNGGIGNSQLVWLKKELDDAGSGNQKVLIFCHFPIVPDNIHNLLNYKEVLSLLNGYRNTVAWFNGHNHAGNYGNFNNIHFVTFKGMVETESDNSYAIVDVYTNKIWIRGFGREKSQILAY